MSIVKREGSPYYWYSFTIGGRRFRGSTGTDDASLAKAFVARERTRIWEQAHLGKKEVITLNHAFGRFLLEHVQYLKSKKSVTVHCAAILSYFGESALLSEIGTKEMSKYVAHRRGIMVEDEHGQKVQKYSESSINREIAAFRKMYNIARETWDFQVATINFKQLRLREPENRTRWESQDNLDKIIQAAAPHLRGIILFALYTGARLGTILNLEWRDIRNGQITLRDVKSATRGKLHHVPIVTPLIDVLNAQPVLDDCPKVFTYKGLPIKSVKRAWATALKNAKVSDFRFHDLRHTCATWLIQAGTPIEIVKDILGHSNISTTLKYAHHKPTEKQDAMEKVLAQYRHTKKPHDDNTLNNGDILGKAI